MTRRSRTPFRRQALLVLVGFCLTFSLAICLARGAWAAEEGQPVYRERLSLPVAGDAIGYPTSVTADPHTGEIFVADQRAGRILIYGPEGGFRYEIAGGDTFSSVYDVAVDPEGYIVAAVRHDLRLTVFELDFDGLPLGEVVLTGLPEGVSEPRVQSLAMSPAGDLLYLLDSANQRVWITRRNGEVEGSIDLLADLEGRRRRDFVAGRVDVSGDTVVVAQTSEGLISYYDLDGTWIDTIGQKGTASCQLAFPMAAARNRQGDFIIIDRQRMILMLWSDSDRCLGEHYGIGDLPGYFYHPLDLALDTQGRLYVTQGFEGRVQVYEGLVPVPGPR